MPLIQVLINLCLNYNYKYELIFKIMCDFLMVYKKITTCIQILYQNICINLNYLTGLKYNTQKLNK